MKRPHPIYEPLVSGKSFFHRSSFLLNQWILGETNWIFSTPAFYFSILRGACDKFPDFFVWAFKIVVDSWKFSMLLLYILWDDWPIFMISPSNEQLQQELEYTLLNPDCHSWWISKMQSWCEDILEEQYAIEFCFKLGKNATETYGMLQTTFQPYCISFWVA